MKEYQEFLGVKIYQEGDKFYIIENNTKLFQPINMLRLKIAEKINYERHKSLMKVR